MLLHHVAAVIDQETLHIDFVLVTCLLFEFKIGGHRTSVYRLCATLCLVQIVFEVVVVLIVDRMHTSKFSVSSYMEAGDRTVASCISSHILTQIALLNEHRTTGGDI